MERSSTLRSVGGGIAGERTLREDAAVLELGGSTKLTFARRRLRLRVPVSVAHRSTAGGALGESRGRAGLAGRYKWSPKLRISVSAAVAGRWRPNWPDQYQPRADGSLGPTDRYSRWQRDLGGAIAAIPLRHQHVRASYNYVIFDYREDANFAAVDDPNHLVPGDRSEHRAELSWLHFGDGWKLGGGATGFLRSDNFAFARDAGTGLTHANPGGPPPNPLQGFRGAEPYVRYEFGRIKDALSFDLQYGLEVVQDTFEGYYSYMAHHPTVAMGLRPDDATKLSLKIDVRLRRYGANSYAEGGRHPALAYGTRRVDRRASIKLRARRALTSSWTAISSANLALRRTNFPDYRPGIFPSTKSYDIRWSYTNWRLLAGAELTL